MGMKCNGRWAAADIDASDAGMVVLEPRNPRWPWTLQSIDEVCAVAVLRVLWNRE